ncbi:MAG: hypothetical protein KGK34_01110 [Chloroflexota bacterium]|nr:hypothetical protein [Chloroflexota bacterium]
MAEVAAGLTAHGLAGLLAEFQQPGQPLHGLPQAEAERIFVQVVEQLLLRAMQDRLGRQADN